MLHRPLRETMQDWENQTHWMKWLYILQLFK